MDNSTIKKEFLHSEEFRNPEFSAVSSRLLTGNNKYYAVLENTISAAYQKEACLVFNSGYHANIGILPALTEKNDLILADKTVHASIIDGMRLSAAEVKRFKHIDYAHLDTLLAKYRTEYENVFIVTESIFSMDGDIADIKTLVDLKKKYNTFLYIDEAHAVGVRGSKGLGISEESGLIHEIDFIIGTFGKAYASLGAFLVCDDIFKQYMVNCSRSMIYTTALPPLNLAWSHFIFNKVLSFTNERKQLTRLYTELSRALGTTPQSQIIPFIIGNNKNTIDCFTKLREKGFYVLPIRHPTVPEGTARLRLSLKIDLRFDQLEVLAEYLKNYAKKLVI